MKTEVHARSAWAAFPVGKVMPHLIEQESGGNGMAVSPAGALGSTQMLPATAQEMAKKLGVPWRPDLLRNGSPEGLQYQRRLGEAYLKEGYEKTGSLEDALKYYHGGPNRQMWGPKTRAYAKSVLGRIGGR